MWTLIGAPGVTAACEITTSPAGRLSMTPGAIRLIAKVTTATARMRFCRRVTQARRSFSSLPMPVLQASGQPNAGLILYTQNARRRFEVAASMYGRDLLSINDLSPEELVHLVEMALAMKRDGSRPLLEGKTIAML